jgi:uncharacterized protein YuzE
MRITYDPEVDVLYIELRAGLADDSLDLEDGVTADLDADGHVLGIEFLDARERLGNDALATVALEQLPLVPTPPHR